MSYLSERRRLKNGQPKQGKKSKPIAKMSAKQTERMKVYKKLRYEFMKDHPQCQALLACSGSPASDIHHIKGRIGKNLFNTENFLSVCRPCHTKIHDKHSLAKILGLIKSRLSA